jgi:hypothetical protein
MNKIKKTIQDLDENSAMWIRNSAKIETLGKKK